MFDHPEKRASALAFFALAVALVALVIVARSIDDTPLAALRERVEALESEVAALRERAASGESTVPVKDLFTIASMEAQMKRLRAEVEWLKAHGGGEGGAGAVAMVEQRQERVLKEANKAFHRTWKESLDAGLAQNGFDEDRRRRIGGDYARLLEEIEDVQLRWFRGDINWDQALDEVKMRSIEFYDAVERNYDTDTARRVLDIAFPTPEMKRFFFSGSGQ